MKKCLLFCVMLLSAVVFSGELRCVSFSPALTELVCHLQKEHCLVGRSVSCDRPVSVKKLPVAGDFAKPDLEKLAKLKPDLVLADNFQDASVKRSLEALGIKVVVLPLNSMANYRHAVLVLGDMLDAKNAADQEVKRMDTFLEELRKRITGRVRPRVMYVVWHTPLMLPGKQSFLTEWISLAGGESLGRDHNRAYFRAAPEWILTMKPEVLIFPGGDRANFPGWWKRLPAVQKDNVFLPEDESLFFRLSPRFDRALTVLEKIIRKQ